jgi:hypothetical protein
MARMKVSSAEVVCEVASKTVEQMFGRDKCTVSIEADGIEIMEK